MQVYLYSINIGGFPIVQSVDYSRILNDQQFIPSFQEGVAYKGQVWFQERSDIEACNLLIDEELKCIQNHNENIQILKSTLFVLYTERTIVSKRSSFELFRLFRFFLKSFVFL